MIDQIKNDKLQVTVKRHGAEICSIKSVVSGKEFIWEANPEIWANHAPILFPIVGALKGGTYFYNNKEYALPQHGFMRHNQNVNLVEKSSSCLKFSLKSNARTLEVYPFNFEFITMYLLEGNTIQVTHEVYNPSDREIYFSLGAHPAFKCPVDESENYSDYYLEFERNEDSKTWQIVEGLIGNQTMEVFNGSNSIELHPDIFNNGALVFKDLKSTKVSLKSKKSDRAITVYFKGFPYMGLWAKPKAKFVCIEPWQGIADSVDANQNIVNKEGIIKLAGKEEYSSNYKIEIAE